MKKLSFSIITESMEDQKNIATDQHIRKNRYKAQTISQFSQARKELSQETIHCYGFDKITLIEILETYQDGKLWDNLNPINNTLEVFCQYFWDLSKFSTFSGQLLINNEDEEIILTLIDVSRQNKFQEERIKDQFKTSIVQSFSHELRTPLNSSCNFLQFCLNDRSINEDIKIISQHQRQMHSDCNPI